MREHVRPLVGKRTRYRGTFVRYAVRRSHKGAILLRDIFDLQRGVVVLRHVWLTRTKGMKPLGDLQAGDEVEFDARLWTYPYGDRSQDERARLASADSTADTLSHPTRFARVKRERNSKGAET